MPDKKNAAGGQPAADQQDAGVASITNAHYITPASAFLLCDRGMLLC